MYKHDNLCINYHKLWPDQSCLIWADAAHFSAQHITRWAGILIKSCSQISQPVSNSGVQSLTEQLAAVAATGIEESSKPSSKNSPSLPQRSFMKRKRLEPSAWSTVSRQSLHKPIGWNARFNMVQPHQNLFRGSSWGEHSNRLVDYGVCDHKNIPQLCGIGTGLQAVLAKNWVLKLQRIIQELAGNQGGTYNTALIAFIKTCQKAIRRDS